MENKIFKLDEEEIRFLKENEINVEAYTNISKAEVVEGLFVSCDGVVSAAKDKLRGLNNIIDENKEAIHCLETQKKELKNIDYSNVLNEEINKLIQENEMAKKNTKVFEKIINHAMHDFVIDINKEYIKKGKMKDIIYGCAVGDAMAVPYKYSKRDTFDCKDMVGNSTYNKPVGTWSNNTAIVLAMLDSIIENDYDVNECDITKKYKEWAFKGKYAIDNDVFDRDNTMYNAIVLDDVPETSLSNDILMRIMPLVFTDYNHKNKAGDTSLEKVIRIINSDNWSGAYVCREYLDTLRYLMYEKSLDFVLDQSFRYDYIFLKSNRKNIRSSRYIKDTFKSVIWSLVNSTNYKDAILNAVNLGGDTDTITSLTGALAGALYGYNDIPKDWIDKLRGKDIIDSIINKANV